MFKKKEPVFTCELKAICEAKGIMPQELASVVGVSKKTIQRIQEGKYNPSLELAYEISGALDCRVEEVFPRVGGK
ncbi:helix-turn-helix transcriptional regulator [Enterococcus plantarum]|nr:helix-turn-helix domain-containing protein [Enterococcus plantarum]